MITKPSIKACYKNSVVLFSLAGNLILDFRSEWFDSVEKVEDFFYAGKYNNIIDTTDVEQISSWGIERIKSLVRRIASQRNRAILVVRPDSQVSRSGLFVEVEATGMLVPFVPDVETAITYIGKE